MMRKKKHALFAFHGHRLDKLRNNQYNIWAIGVWRSLVSRLVRVQEASGSNPDTPTTQKHPTSVMDVGRFYAFTSVN